MFTMVFKATYEAHGASLCGSVHPFLFSHESEHGIQQIITKLWEDVHEKKKNVYWCILVGGSNMFKTFFIFHFIYGMSSFPLTFTHIFQIWLKPASSIFWGGRTLNGIFVRERAVSENGTDPDPFHQHCLWVQILDPFDPSFHGWFNTHNVKGAEGPLFWVNYSDLTSRPNPGNHGLFLGKSSPNGLNSG